jgi:phosphoribosylformylglycinamidine synthase
MAMEGDRGVALDPLPSEVPPHAWLFGEDQARYLIEAADAEEMLRAALAAGVPARRIGTVGDAALTLPGAGAISIAELKAAHEAWLPAYMAQT